MNLLANHFLYGCTLTKQPNNHTSNITKNEVSEPPEQMAMVLWDINHTSSLVNLAEEEEPPEILLVQIRGRGPITQNQPIIAQAPKNPKRTTFSAQPPSIPSSPPKFQTPEPSKLDYNAVEDLKKIK
jgi:hypothetical protein